MNRALFSKTSLVGAAFFGIAIIWPIFNTFVPIFLAELGLSATLVGFIFLTDRRKHGHNSEFANDQFLNKKGGKNVY